MKDLEREAYEYANAMPVNVLKALSEFQQEVPTIHKGTKGYGYSYADLPTIFEVINPLMKKHGLGFTQLMQGTQLETIIFHSESGEYLRSIADIPQDVQLKGMNDFQVAGSAITYFRRYALSSALGLVTDVDNDANVEQKPKQQRTDVKEQESKKELPILNEKMFNTFMDSIGKFSEKKKGIVDLTDIEEHFEVSEDYKQALQTRYEENMPKPITEADFEKATEAVEKGTVTVAQIKAKYVLSTTQEKALELLEGLFKK